MKRLMFAAVTFSCIALAGSALGADAKPAAADPKAPAAAPAKKDEKAAAPAAAPAKKDDKAVAAAPDCDMCKSMGAMAKAGKMETYKLNNGTMSIITTSAKGQPALDKSVEEMNGAMKNAMEGKAKLCEPCTKMVETVKSGKVLMGDGKIPNGYVHTQLSADAETVKQMHEGVDKMAAMAPKKK